jgi:hypothetical protein
MLLSRLSSPLTKQPFSTSHTPLFLTSPPLFQQIAEVHDEAHKQEEVEDDSKQNLVWKMKRKRFRYIAPDDIEGQVKLLRRAQQQKKFNPKMLVFIYDC